ncbi:hypothetical protein DMC30DRAFT_109143 [Rhodotorula diobovata]|uniref:Arrestin-like N-terminal domain-containing protein n=1 Tax=Rhodotorula diobovata TaxID=5288 RepID=A0A5C5G603_9BASI|nr:hypothetical protein DMC30DRAFT_109143 [Rhodotorula diobovata]
MVHKAPPPALDSPAELSASSSRLSLSLRVPSPGAIYPGLTIHPAIRLRGDSHYERITLRLVAESRANIMGKARWQAGAAANVGMGAPGGGMPITTPERLTFVELDIPLLSTPTTAAQDKKAAASAEGLTGEGIYEVAVPFPPEGQLLPAFAQKEYDAAGVSVAWSLELEGYRKGWYRQNDKLSLDLPIVFPLPSSGPPLEATLTKQLKFEGNEPGGLSTEATIYCEPILTSSATLRYRLLLRPSSPTAMHLLRSSELKPSASIARQIRTAPIANPNSGREFEWAAVRLKTGELVPVEAEEEGTLEWRGELEVPEGECTVESKGTSIRYTLSCHLHSTIFAKAGLHVPLAIFLPSSPVELRLLEHDASDSAPEASGSALPPYQP